MQNEHKKGQKLSKICRVTLDFVKKGKRGFEKALKLSKGANSLVGLPLIFIKGLPKDLNR